MKFSLQAVKFGLFFANFAFFGLNSTAYSAPRVPEQLKQNSLIYCTNASSFSLKPQQADMGANINVVTDQIYDKLFEIDAKTNQLKSILVESYNIAQMGLPSRCIYAKMCRSTLHAGLRQPENLMPKM